MDAAPSFKREAISAISAWRASLCCCARDSRAWSASWWTWDLPRGEEGGGGGCRRRPPGEGGGSSTTASSSSSSKSRGESSGPSSSKLSSEAEAGEGGASSSRAPPSSASASWLKKISSTISLSSSTHSPPFPFALAFALGPRRFAPAAPECPQTVGQVQGGLLLLGYVLVVVVVVVAVVVAALAPAASLATALARDEVNVRAARTGHVWVRRRRRRRRSPRHCLCCSSTGSPRAG
mmetsp:Transcript_29832/g.88572  ORF Transcript_29832/g.88572 Transcript_29832/m.88572 type:complete len:236 (+) Transcript_29832:1566-2273(+)